MRLTSERTSALMGAAATGDRESWEALVDAYAGLVWAITRNYRLTRSDAADVSQTAWLRLVENMDRIEDATKVGAWLATTTRRECLRLLGQTRSQLLLGDAEEFDGLADDGDPVDAALLSAESRQDVRAALSQLPPRCQQLISLLMLDPAPSYEEISAAMGIPLGSIGPTRGRCLRRLRAILDS